MYDSPKSFDHHRHFSVLVFRIHYCAFIYNVYKKYIPCPIVFSNNNNCNRGVVGSCARTPLFILYILCIGTRFRLHINNHLQSEVGRRNTKYANHLHVIRYYSSRGSLPKKKKKPPSALAPAEIFFKRKKLARVLIY